MYVCVCVVLFIVMCVCECVAHSDVCVSISYACTANSFVTFSHLGFYFFSMS